MSCKILWLKRRENQLRDHARSVIEKVSEATAESLGADGGNKGNKHNEHGVFGGRGTPFVSVAR
jgi:hypothetical protein